MYDAIVLMGPPGDLVAGFYDAWTDKIAPGWKFDLEVDGTDVDSASAAIARFLG